MSAPLSEIDVLVVDCQSTGARPKNGALLELAWCRARAADEPPDGGQLDVVSHLVQLPEGARIPRAVSRLTGITLRDLDEAVPPEVVYRDLLAFAATVDPVAVGRTPTIIHYASYEKAWLQHLRDQFDGDVVSMDVVCTHEIAKRLLALPRQGLRALAGYFGFAPDLIRRSAGHVRATAHVWRHLARGLADIGVHTWSDLLVWLKDTPPLSRKDRKLPMSRDKRLSLPDKPGVYRMLRSNGDVLYVGKATSLKKRVNSYFTKRRGHHERTMEMLTQARDLDVTVTESALEAALLEADLIKERRPPYNVQLRDEARHAWFATTDLSDAATAPDEAFRVGPLPSRYALGSYAALRAILVDGTDAVPRDIAKAMAMPPAFGPDSTELTGGTQLFAARYDLETFTHAGLMSLSKRLLALSRAGKLDVGERGDDDRGWDPPRVARHLERVVLQSGQLVRRARWLCLLSEASVSWQMPDAPVRRALVVHHAVIEERLMLPADHTLPAPPGAHRQQRERQAAFDIAAYDRLRILTTELKRIVSEGCDVDVRLGERVILRGPRLLRLLETV